MGQRWRVSFRTGSSQSMSNSFSDSVGPAVAPPAEAPSAARAAVPAAVFADDFGLLGGMVFTTSRRARQEARTEIGLRGSRRRARTSGGRAAGLATTPRATTGGKPRLCKEVPRTRACNDANNKSHQHQHGERGNYNWGAMVEEKIGAALQTQHAVQTYTRSTQSHQATRTTAPRVATQPCPVVDHPLQSRELPTLQTPRHNRSKPCHCRSRTPY